MRRITAPQVVRTSVFALLGLAASSSSADPVKTSPAGSRPPVNAAAPEEDLGPLLAKIRKQHDVPALCAAFVRHDRVTAIGVDGVRRRGDATKATLDDLWHLGSCTKSMTATLCARLVEENVLKFDDSLDRFGEGFFPKDADAGWKHVTLEQLLTNRSGLPTDLPQDVVWGVLARADATPVEQRRHLFEGMLRHRPEQAPGSKFVYSNAGFSIAGVMAETRTKTAWEDLIRAKVFTPLGMTTAGFGAPGKADVLDQPRGHKTEGSPVEPGGNADNPAAIAPAGRVHLAIRDWAKYVSTHLLGARGESTFLSRGSFDRLHEPPAGFEYAMGWVVAERPWGGGTVLTHAGSNLIWYCTTWIAPRRDFAVLICCNQGGDAAAKACDDVAAALVTR